MTSSHLLTQKERARGDQPVEVRQHRWDNSPAQACLDCGVYREEGEDESCVPSLK